MILKTANNNPHEFLNSIIIYLPIIISAFSLIVSFIQSKRNKKNQIETIKANYYSYPILKNRNSCKIIIPIDNFCIINSNINTCNILNLKGNNLIDNYFIQLSFSFKNMSKIYPYKALVSDLTIYYKNDEYEGEKILKEFAHFCSVDNKSKRIFIDGNGNIIFDIKCLVSKEIRENLIKSLDKDLNIQFSFNIIFENTFNVITKCKYDICLAKSIMRKKRNSTIIGDNKNYYEFYISKLQYQIVDITLAGN